MSFGAARTNYFQVNDLDAFREAIAPVNRGSEVIIIDDSSEQGICLLCKEEEGLPCFYYDEEEGDLVEFDLLSIIGEHLKEGSVAILVELVADKMRVLFGAARAINSAGERRSVSLFDIDKLAEELGENVTLAQY